MDYIQLYADVEGDDADVSSDDDQQSYNQDEVNFIDNVSVSSDRNFYRQFKNVERDLNKPVNDLQDWLDLHNLQSENYLTHPENFDKVEFDKFNNVKERANKFKSKYLMLNPILVAGGGGGVKITPPPS